MTAKSELLRRILGCSHDAAQNREDRCTSFVRFDGEEATRIRVALAKGAETPSCPRCGEALRRESVRSRVTGGLVGAFLCEPCRRAVVIRLSDDRPALRTEDAGSA